MIDWTKERTTKNYCGWCLNDPTAYCDGRCFTEGDPKKLCNIKIDHIQNEIIKSQKRLNDLKEELTILTYRSNET